MADSPNNKLIDAKQAWAKAGRLLTGRPGDPRADRLPPGQRLVRDWPVLDLGIVPKLSAADWKLTIDGAVENPLEWSWEEFLAEPQVELVTDIHCVTQWSRFDNRWRGVATRHIVERVRPRADVAHVLFESYDGYTTNLTLEQFAGEDCLVAFEHDGRPLSAEHGGPARLVVPRFYFWKSPKWLKRISFSVTDQPGFWEVRGYNNHADPWLEERYE